MNLNLHHLKIFYTVIQEQSFSKAAQKLYLTQPAVSKAVKALENQLDLPLLDRTPGPSSKSIRLTNDGAVLFEHARQIFALERAALEEMQSRHNQEYGKLIIGASTTVAAYSLPRYLTAYHKQYPKIELTLKVGNTQLMAQALIDCEIDLAIVEGQVDNDLFTTEIWQQETLCIVVPNHHRLAKLTAIDISHLNQETWICREVGSGTYDVVQKIMHQLMITPAHLIEIGSNNAIAQAVAAGLGIAILPYNIIQLLEQTEKITTIHLANRPKLTRDLYLLGLKRRPASKLTDSFYQLLHNLTIR